MNLHRLRQRGRALHGLVAFAVALGAVGCERQAPAAKRIEHRAAAAGPRFELERFRPQPIGAAIGRPPWIAHVCPVDLDQDGLMDVLVCDSRENTIGWIRQVARGLFEEKTIGTDMRAPVHVEAADMDHDGDLDVLVSSMSEVFPNNDRIGAVFILENVGRGDFRSHLIIENTSRVTDARAADLNGDGKLDLALGQFGYDQGEIAWLERGEGWQFQRHVLLELSGAINACVDDFNADGKPDIIALISQQWEEVYYFENDGRGNFTSKRVWGSTNEDYGSSGLSVCDLNRDGRPDVVYSNGDGFGPAAMPGPRPWHGVQWLENKGGGQFRYHRIGTLPGAYSPVGTDVDGDGATDVVAVAGYADWTNKSRSTIALMWFRNDGQMNFEPHVLARAPKDQITLGVADFDGNGRPALVTGGFYVYPPYENMGRVTLWRQP